VLIYIDKYRDEKFDPIPPGHLSYLSSAATLRDKLVEVQYDSICEETDIERQ
jgi:hypothetical protein